MAAESDAGLLLKLRQQGFQNPQQILVARTAAKLGLPVACAMLMMESAGGHNEFGHDEDHLGRCPGWGWGAVTQPKYEAFAKLRDASGRSNGVGPAQLTSPALQAEADKAGGCWLPQHNMAVGFHYLHDLIETHGSVQAGAAAYNGSGPAAQQYGEHLLTLADHYKALGLGSVVGILD